MPLSVGAPELEEAALLEEDALEAVLDEAALLDDEVTLDEDELLAAELDEEVDPLHEAAVSCAPFLPTPAYWASLSFTHCAETGS